MATKRTTAAKMEEVTDLEAQPAAPQGLDLEGGLIFVTFIALVVGIVLGQLVLKHYFGAGMLA